MEEGSDRIGFIVVDALIFPIPLAGQISIAMHFDPLLKAGESETRQRNALMPLALKHLRNPADNALSILYYSLDL